MPTNTNILALPHRNTFVRTKISRSSISCLEHTLLLLQPFISCERPCYPMQWLCHTGMQYTGSLRIHLYCIIYALSFKIKLLKIQIRASIDFYPCCLFQQLVFSERREIVATDRLTDWQTDRLTDWQTDRLTPRLLDYCMPRGSAHRGIIMHVKVSSIATSAACCNDVQLTNEESSSYTVKS